MPLRVTFEGAKFGQFLVYEP